MSADGAREQEGTVADPAPWRSRFVRPKGHIDPAAMSLLLIVGGVPLILAFSRILALPGADVLGIFDFDSLRGLGRLLNESVSLRWVPPDDRPAILYLLLLPTGALLVAMARLTFGLRVLGLRAILIAIGFQEIGFLPSFALMIVVIGTIIAIRPSMRRMRLPLYARITMILGIVATLMVGALLLGPWLHSEIVWSVAFFPVIIMAMLAEGIARTIVNDDVVTAIWRAGWTIVLALIIAMIGQSTAISNFALHFPELLLTQIVGIVLIAEFLDLRLLEHWPARLSRLVAGVRPWCLEKTKVAVVHNRWSSGVIGRLGRPAPAGYRRRSVQRVVDALRDQGFEVRVFEGDMTLLRELQQFLPPDPRTGAPGGIVLNLASGVQGEGRFCHVPAMLEMAGIAYTGPDPIAHAHLVDRYILMTLLKHAGVRVPRFSLVSGGEYETALNFPLCVGPRCEPDAAPIVARDRQALEAAVRDVRQAYAQDVLIEEAVEGREIRAVLFGNERLHCLPLLEYLPRDRRKACPAPINESRAGRVRECAIEAYRAAGCRDYARIDVRLPKSGKPMVIGVNWADKFARHGSLARAAEVGGYSFEEFIARIVEEACIRHGATAPARVIREGGESSVVPLSKREGVAR